MGAKPSSYRKGGGFLNGVWGVITNYRWTDEFNGEPFRAGKSKNAQGIMKERFHSLYLVPSVRIDGADKDETTTLFAGGYDNYEVSEDGLTLTTPEGGPCSISAGSAAGKFLTSIVEAGFDENRFSEDEDSVNLEPIIGQRVHFIQRTNAEDTKKLGKRLDKKTGKTYDRQDLVVDDVDQDYTPAEVAAPKKGTAKPTAVAAKATKKPAATQVDNSSDVKELATETLVSVVAEAGGSIAKNKLSMKFLTKLMKNPLREDARTYVFNDDNLEALAEEGFIQYDRAKGLISAAA